MAYGIQNHTLQHTATHCNALQKVILHYSTPQPAATHCNKLQHSPNVANQSETHTATHHNTLQCTAACCIALQHAATSCNTLQHPATGCNTLQQAATHCNKLQHSLNVVSQSQPFESEPSAIHPVPLNDLMSHFWQIQCHMQCLWMTWSQSSPSEALHVPSNDLTSQLEPFESHKGTGCASEWLNGSKKEVNQVVLRLWVIQTRSPSPNTLQHTATHCNTLQHTATHGDTYVPLNDSDFESTYIYTKANHSHTHICTKVNHSFTSDQLDTSESLRGTWVLPCVAVCCNALQGVAVWYSVALISKAHFKSTIAISKWITAIP